MNNNNPPLNVPKPTIGQRLSMAADKVKRVMGYPTNTRVVHFIILSPMDKPAASIAMVTSVGRAALHLQAWYRAKMGNGKTFTFDVRTFRTDHSSAWYTDNPNGGNHAGYYWNNVLRDAATFAGAGFYQPLHDWVIYVDVNPLPDQYAGGTSGGYISGCAVMGAKDLDALQGLDPDWTQCRAIGGSGHEFGHTLGLPHPPAGPNWAIALMGVGYGTYPAAILTQADKLSLNANPFLAEQERLAPPSGLCPFDDSATT